ncbi:MAG: hypothetical protein IJV08_00025 [Bacteroidaceae bacterium]|nr:hypothetical protein [Bacteroidaceae bacterium]
MSIKGFVLILTAIGLTSNCEKIDWEEEEKSTEEGTTALVVPVSVGYGTQEAPYIVEQVMKGTNIGSGLKWYIGYVVGSTYSTMKNAVFEGETSYTSNILLSSDSTCQNIDRCIPVELKSASIQQKLSLHHNEARFRQCVVVKARFGQYFRTNGLRDVQTGYWLPAFDLSQIKATPAEWQEWHSTY